MGRLTWHTPLIWLCWAVAVICLPFALLCFAADAQREELEAARARRIARR
ncbi:hypothetical protein [Pseudooceanicola nanhaiensis]